VGSDDGGGVGGVREHLVRRLKHAPHPFGDSSHCALLVGRRE
jgi:hypothetical protein